MPKVTIQQFRAALTGRSDRGGLVRAYRELSGRPGLGSAASFAGWGDWSTPPGRASA
jgi:hypothetical protein